MKKIIGVLIALYSAFAFSATTIPVQLLNPTGSSSGQAIVSTGASSAPAWGGIGVNGIAAIAANTVLANATGSSASPIAFAMPSCTGASNALGYTSGTGIVCNSAINAAQLGGATFAAPGPVGSTTASTGKFTTLQATSTITPSTTAGIVGTTLADNAQAGSVGEYITATGTAVSLTTSTSATITSISLTAGDWDVWGNIYFTPAATTVLTSAVSGINTTAATLPAIPGYTFLQAASAGANQPMATVAPTIRISVASTTTVYLIGFAAFSTSTCTATGIISARRVR